VREVGIGEHDLVDALMGDQVGKSILGQVVASRMTNVNCSTRLAL
jgi:hypothetical protein